MQRGEREERESVRCFFQTVIRVQSRTDFWRGEERADKRENGELGEGNIRAEKEGRKRAGELNDKFQIDRVDPSNLPIETAHSQNKNNLNCIKQNWFLCTQCPDECAAKQHKALSASSHMTAVLEDTVFHFNLITMLKLQPALEHIHSLRPW